MKKILLPIMVFIYSANISAGPLTLDCQSSTEMDENLKDIAAATTGGTNGADECPAPSKDAINSLCGEVRGQQRDEDEESQFNHLYEKTLWNISCAFPTDATEVAKNKIQTMWKKHHTQFKCSKDDFVLVDGNILKYGVQNSFEEFLHKVIKDYKLEINFKDPKDGKTVLDFAQNEFDKIFAIAPESEKAKSLKKTIDFLKQNGAKQAKDV